MRDFLVSQGIPPESILLEDQSRITYENARQSARLLREHHRPRHPRHRRTSLIRAERAFRRQGWPKVLPSGCRYRTAAEHPFTPRGLHPPASETKRLLRRWHSGLAWPGTGSPAGFGQKSTSLQFSQLFKKTLPKKHPSTIMPATPKRPNQLSAISFQQVRTPPPLSAFAT